MSPPNRCASTEGARRETDLRRHRRHLHRLFWPASSTTPGPGDRYRRVRVTHPFHPLSGREYELVEHRNNWGEDRVCVRDADGELFSLLTCWTDAAPPEPFVVVAAGRCPFTTGDL